MSIAETILNHVSVFVYRLSLLPVWQSTSLTAILFAAFVAVFYCITVSMVID